MAQGSPALRTLAVLALLGWPFAPVRMCNELELKNNLDMQCLVMFKSHMEELGSDYWCDWLIISSLYNALTNCTQEKAGQSDCFWPNSVVDAFFLDVHRRFFSNCSRDEPVLADPPDTVLGLLVAGPAVLAAALTALIVWLSKRREGVA
ncbi:receptor activity-modifying protein 1-like [Petromyzon marinus]|uniref:Receptor activity-modifying protein 1-like n=1 Tax=Petromyzon marinus TaxID=7757 RepID=A0AAJ7SMX2_PETMA|nr:receptor activity-modifying protein 1-like [Petromyzon marinus]